MRDKKIFFRLAKTSIIEPSRNIRIDAVTCFKSFGIRFILTIRDGQQYSSQFLKKGASTEFSGDGGKNLLFALKTTKKILFFSKKSKNILFFAGLGRSGRGEQVPPSGRPWAYCFLEKSNSTFKDQIILPFFNLIY